MPRSRGSRHVATPERPRSRPCPHIRYRPSSEAGASVLMLATLAAAVAGGLLARRLRLPGGLLVGSAIGAAAVTLASESRLPVPAAMNIAIPIAVGTLTGLLLTRKAVRELRSVLLMAVCSGVAIIALGLGVAAALEAIGWAPPAVALATSPGALSVLVGTAIEVQTGSMEVAMFHMVRLMLVVLLSPLLVALLRHPDP
ncbi:AbrB family transcriptional regulator [Blastococcus brunescens]|uniref:AbrB family transcriptional regulator n=1 Tax=Blastococcus brunescens TaxID=1564165 RepID=A0ABZ1B1R0_9ACTN|nr:AbrB family transcriptional regulator [Blastococcus sp. BMG 8361]WRL64747.1 AbrB family transcriptional regulator [Blastococcus sp. BMG 8361]